MPERFINLIKKGSALVQAHKSTEAATGEGQRLARAFGTLS